MKREMVLRHEFVEYIPDDIQDGTMYISIAYATVAHMCCCGCGNEVITPLAPTDWKLIFDGESISLDPSIGNWNFPCQSHYWIRRNKVKWATRCSQQEIQAGRYRDTVTKERYYNDTKTPDSEDSPVNNRDPKEGKVKESLWQRVKRWLF